MIPRRHYQLHSNAMIWFYSASLCKCCDISCMAAISSRSLAFLEGHALRHQAGAAAVRGLRRPVSSRHQWVKIERIRVKRDILPHSDNIPRGERGGAVAPGSTRSSGYGKTPPVRDTGLKVIRPLKVISGLAGSASRDNPAPRSRGSTGRGGSRPHGCPH